MRKKTVDFAYDVPKKLSWTLITKNSGKFRNAKDLRMKPSESEAKSEQKPHALKNIVMDKGFFRGYEASHYGEVIENHETDN